MEIKSNNLKINNFEKIKKLLKDKLKGRKKYYSSLKIKLKEILNKIKTNLINFPYKPLKVSIEGSIGKKTYLVNSDIDIIVKFRRKDSINKDNLFDLFLKQFSNVFLNKIIFSEHPYLNCSYEGIIFDLCPCFDMKIGDKIISSIDRTPIHKKIILKNLKNDKSLLFEILITKIFFKEMNLYGSNSYIQGFAGYAIELLISKFKSLENLLIFFSQIKTIPLNLEKENLFYKFKSDNIILLDPADLNRNVLSSVSKELVYKLIYISKLSLISKDFLFSFFKKSSLKIIKNKINYFINKTEKNNILTFILNLNFNLEGKEKQDNFISMIKSNLFSKLNEYFLNVKIMFKNIYNLGNSFYIFISYDFNNYFQNLSFLIDFKNIDNYIKNNLIFPNFLSGFIYKNKNNLVYKNLIESLKKLEKEFINENYNLEVYNLKEFYNLIKLSKNNLLINFIKKSFILLNI